MKKEERIIIEEIQSINNRTELLIDNREENDEAKKETTALAGRIYWFENLENLKGCYTDVEAEITKITNVIINDETIKFDWKDVANHLKSGTANLTNTLGSFYAGDAIITGSETFATVEAELFENKRGYLMKGTWIEDDGKFFHWWAEVNK